MRNVYREGQFILLFQKAAKPQLGRNSRLFANISENNIGARLAGRQVTEISWALNGWGNNLTTPQ